MSSVIVNEDGELYAGFSSEESKPVWRKTKSQGCILDDAIAKLALKQLHGLGFTKTVIRDAGAVVRKWVPADMDVLA